MSGVHAYGLDGRKRQRPWWSDPQLLKLAVGTSKLVKLEPTLSEL